MWEGGEGERSAILLVSRWVDLRFDHGVSCGLEDFRGFERGCSRRSQCDNAACFHHRYPWLPHNYCRNPDLSPSAWCYTTDPAVPREDCAVGSPGIAWGSAHRCGAQCRDGCSVCQGYRSRGCLECAAGHAITAEGACQAVPVRLWATVVARGTDPVTWGMAGLALLVGWGLGRRRGRGADRYDFDCRPDDVELDDLKNVMDADDEEEA